MHDPEDEPVFDRVMDFAFETDPNLDLAQIKKLMMKEISSYNAAYLEYVWILKFNIW